MGKRPRLAGRKHEHELSLLPVRERQPADRLGVAPFDAPVGTVEQLEVDPVVVHADGRELSPEGLRTEVEVVLVAAPGIDPDGAQAAQRLGTRARHADRVPRQPALPDLGDQLAGRDVEGQLDRPVRIGRVAGGHGVLVDERRIGALRPARAGAEIGPEGVERAVVLVAELAADGRRTGAWHLDIDVSVLVADDHGRECSAVRPTPAVCDASAAPERSLRSIFVIALAFRKGKSRSG